MGSVGQDARYAIRALRRNPLFTAVAVACLALGIGVNATVYSIVYGLLYRPFPFPHPEQLVVLEETQTRSGVADAPVSYANLRDWREASTSFAVVGAVSDRSLALSGPEGAERVPGAAASWELFPALGVRPALGRGFTAEDDRPGAAPVVVIGHTLWERRFGGARGALGKTVLVDGAPHTVVGVMPEGFGWPRNQQAWVPLAPLAHAAARTERQLFVIARLRPGVSVEQARAEMGGVARRMAERFPAENGGWGIRVASLRDELVGEGGDTIFLAMLGAVSFVLLIACANVANLMLARTVGRAREMAVRAALGAGRGRIARQLLTESAILSLAAGAAGAALAVAGVRVFVAMFPPENAIPTWIHFRVDGPVLLYTLALAMATGLLFGVAPALRASRADLQTTLREGGRGAAGRTGKLAGLLVVAQVALSLTLLVGASLSIRSIAALRGASAGFDTAPLMTFELALPGEAYSSPEVRARRAEELAQRVAALPGVVGAGVSPATPLGGGTAFGNVEVEGRAFARGEEPGVDYAGATGGWLRTLGVPMLRGRALTDDEARRRSGVAVVNAAMAARLWPGADAVGRRFRVAGGGEWLTVVGVVADFRDASIRPGPVGPAAYLPLPYTPERNLGMIVRVPAGADPASVTRSVRRAVGEVDPNLPVYGARTMEELRRLGFWAYRLMGGMFLAFGVVALVLAAVGLYGVIAYGVAQRTREMGVRMALGAGRQDVLRLVVGRGVKLALAGIAVGMVATWGLSGALRSALYGVASTDPLSFAAGATFLAGVALLASYLPARRAARVDPIVALRAE